MINIVSIKKIGYVTFKQIKIIFIDYSNFTMISYIMCSNIRNKELNKMRLFKTYSPKRWSTIWGHSTAGTNQKNTSTKTGKDTINPIKKA